MWTFTLTQDQAVSIADSVNKHLTEVYQIELEKGFTIPRLEKFMPTFAEEELEQYGFFEIYVPACMAKDNHNHIVEVYKSDVTIEWVEPS